MPRPADAVFAALLRGDALPWSTPGMSPGEILRACRDADLTGLVSERLRRLPERCGWPEEIREGLARDSRAQAATELLRREELMVVLDQLAAAGIDPILLKGTALAYTVYPAPSSRPRLDTDVLIRRSHVDRVRRVMEDAGYSAAPYCGGELLFCQFPLEKRGRFGLVHAFDFHWKISTQTVFAGLLTFEEVSARSTPVPGLGAHARTLSPPDALLLACVHPVMHHRNAGSLLWMYDIHLLASALSERDFERFAALAVARQVAEICAHQLDTAARCLGTRVPASALRTMTAIERREPSAVYLRPNRRWIDELFSSVRGLPKWSERLRLVREVVFPSPAYMLKTHGLAWSFGAVTRLPILYLRRISSGGWRVLAGRK